MIGRVLFSQALSVLAALAILFLVVGCGAKPPPEVRIVTQRVEVPIRVPCKTERPAAPSFAADAVALDASIFDKVRALLTDREQRKAHEADLNGALDRCE